MRTFRPFSAARLALLLALYFGVLLVSRAVPSDCTRTSVGLISLTELGSRAYQGSEGGLYPGGYNTRPAAHEAAGLAVARSIRPLDSSGAPHDIGGRVVFLSVGMSNTTQEFSTFKPMADADPAKNPKLVIVDGAQGGATASLISNLSTSQGQQYWARTDERLAAAGVTPAQVQAAWIKEADAQPSAAFPRYPLQLRDELAVIARILKARYPNIRIAYLSSRIYGGYASSTLNPEPYAYESGFSVKWLIEDQINGDADLNSDPGAGPVKAPWLAWGPYLWADGLTPRSDGLTYKCSDFNPNDGTHPASSGAREKVAKMLLDFLKSDTTAKLWFVRGTSLIFPMLVERVNEIAAPAAKMFTGIALANLEDEDATLTFTAFDKSGSPLAGQEIRNPVTLPLPAGARMARMDFEIFGDGIGIGDQSGWVRVDSTASRMSGFFLAFDSTVSILDGTNASAAGTRSFVLPDIAGGDTAEIRAVNAGSGPAEVRLEVLDATGVARGPAVIRSLAANGVLIEKVTNLFPGSLGEGDYLRISADREVVPVLLWGDPGRYLNALAGQDAGDAAGSLYAPQYVVGGTWRSTLSVVNLDDQRGEVSFEFTPRSGDPVVRLLPIPPRGKIHLGAQDFFVDPAAGLREGHVKVSGNGIRLAGNVVFGDSVRHDSSTALPLVGNMQSELIFSHLVSDAGYYTGIALLNPNSAEADVSLEVYDSLGARLTAEPAHIAGNRSQALILDMLRGLAGISLGSGYIRVKSNQPIAGFALFATRSNSAISAIPAQHIR